MHRRSDWRLALAVVTVVSIAACGGGDKRAASGTGSATAAVDTGPAPDSFRVAFETTRGNFVVQVDRAWAPIGTDRFYRLVTTHFFDGARFFRVVPGFVAQFGLAADPKNDLVWDDKRLPDDSVRHSNLRGTLTFANQGPDTRTYQMFFNLADNPRLDGMGFAPIGQVVDGMPVVDSLYGGYGEEPVQQFIRTLGNSYLDRMFPKLDGIKTARVVSAR